MAVVRASNRRDTTLKKMADSPSHRLRVSTQTVVLVHRVGNPVTEEPAARGLLTHPSVVLVCDPPAELFDGEAVAVVTEWSPDGLAATGTERILVSGGTLLRREDGTVGAVVLELTAPSSLPATPLVGSADAFLTSVVGGRNGAAQALVEAGLLRPEQIRPLGADQRAALESSRLPDWEDGPGDPDGWKWLAWLFR